MSDLKTRYQQVKNRLRPEVNLLAVSKTRPVEAIKTLLTCGQIHFGENKVQELIEKAKELEAEDIQWHFIGHLQSNKINQLLTVKKLEYIHSIDSINLLEKILKKSPLNTIKIFLQVNTSGESEKGGFNPNSLGVLDKAVELLQQSKGFELVGLMTIGKIRTENFNEEAKKSFQLLTDIKAELDSRHDLNLQLSMGMSQDLEIAQNFGTNWVRIGTEIFGPRV